MRHIQSLLYPTLFLALSTTAMSANVDQIAGAGEERAAEGRKAQKTITDIAEQTEDLTREYRAVSKIVDGLKVYNGLLRKQVDNQNREIDTLRESIQGVALIERQIIPQVVNMIDALELFINGDIPFLMEEREQRLLRLRAMMDRPDVTAAERFRKVLEAYQIENEYGRTLEAYKGAVDVDGAEREVNFLRVGRVALLYQTLQGDLSGAWNKETGQWETLPPEEYKKQVASGLRIARKQAAPDLLVIPVPAASVSAARETAE